MEKEKGKAKKKTNVVLYTIFMAIFFFVITELVIWKYASDLIILALMKYPQGNLIIGEAVLAALVLIVMLLFKNSYVFTQKREKVTKGLYYGLFYIICALMFTLTFVSGFKGGLAVINLLIGCFLIGVAEEFLCRGWLLNEFLERFGSTKKGVWYSIIISGLIFGLMHLGNIVSMGQDVATTLGQVISAASTGIVLGLIYYKTKNIWSVVILHGFWDFSLFLSDIAPITETTVMINTVSIVGIIGSILIGAAELINLIPHLKDIDAEPPKGKVIGFAFAAFGAFIAATAINAVLGGIETGDTYKFDSISIGSYSITRDNYEDYYMKYGDYSYRLFETEGNLVLTNTETKYSITLECEDLFDYIIMEDDDYFIIAYVDYTDSSNPFLNYAYVYKSDISNSNVFVDSIKTKFKKYLISDRNSELLVLDDRTNDKTYLAAYHADYGYALLVSEDKMAILNRD